MSPHVAQPAALPARHKTAVAVAAVWETVAIVRCLPQLVQAVASLPKFRSVQAATSPFTARIASNQEADTKSNRSAEDESLGAFLLLFFGLTDDLEMIDLGNSKPGAVGNNDRWPFK